MVQKRELESLKCPSDLNWTNVKKVYKVLKNILPVAKSVMNEYDLFYDYALVKVFFTEEKIKEWDSASKISQQYGRKLLHT